MNVCKKPQEKCTINIESITRHSSCMQYSEMQHKPTR